MLHNHVPTVQIEPSCISLEEKVERLYTLHNPDKVQDAKFIAETYKNHQSVLAQRVHDKYCLPCRFLADT